MTRKILCLYVGGTIGCADHGLGLAPQKGILLQPLMDIANKAIPDCIVDYIEYAQPLDSSLMGPHDWLNVARDVQAATAYDALVILHGTDTLAWTASALYWQLAGMAKPVVITGSQRPWLHAGSDAPANMVLALQTAAAGRAGVWVAFGGKVMPGWAVKKVDADADQAFAAPNWQCEPNRQNTEHPEFEWRPVEPALRILPLKLYPGAEPALARLLRAEQLDALVLECFGSGNLPAHPELAAAIREKAEQGCVIVNCTQCIAGEVRQGLYAAGSLLAEIGALPAGRLGVEAAVTLLYTLLDQNAADETMAKAWQKNADV